MHMDYSAPLGGIFKRIDKGSVCKHRDGNHDFLCSSKHRHKPLSVKVLFFYNNK